jgi:glycosyltransferase involved in cell wall biosynthesis
MGTCYNGLDLGAYLAAPSRPGDYLAFVGRITPEKRPDWAVAVAQRAGLPLKVAAKVDPLDADYHRTVIEPLFEQCDVEFIGEIGEHEKPTFYANARALLFPIDWPEPFGLVMVESLAAGTPVIALRRGSVPEIVEHGVNGAVCDSLDEMVDAVGWIGDVDESLCRKSSRRFSAPAMVDRYLPIYEQLVAEGRCRAELPTRTIGRNGVLAS